LANQLRKNRNLAKLTSPRGNIHTPIRVGIGVAKSGGRVEKEIKNSERFTIQVFKRWKDINTILFLFQDF
jgi:hypothetical protein